MLIEALSAAKSPYHVVSFLIGELEKAGFKEIDDAAPALTPQGRYYLRRGSKTLAAWIQGDALADRPLRLLTAHTDFPALGVRPNAIYTQGNCAIFDADLYDGPLIDTWFDRDLRIAGLVSTLAGDKIDFKTVSLDDVPARLCSIAPHLQSDAGERKTPRLLQCVWGVGVDDPVATFRAHVAQAAGAKVEDLLSYDLWVTSRDAPLEFGLGGALVNSPSVDNVSSCAAALNALIAGAATETRWTRMTALFDFEELGSLSWSGAQSDFLTKLATLVGRPTTISDASFHVSVDVAHGVINRQAGGVDKHNAPEVGKGAVLKLGSPGRYSFSPCLNAMIELAARRRDLPLQTFMYPAGQRRGGSLSPYVAAGLGVRTADVGMPVLGMHSVREMFAKNDASELEAILGGFLTDAYDFTALPAD